MYQICWWIILLGLKHKNYNTSQKIYNKSGLGVPPENTCGVCPRPYKYNYKYNGKGFQDELGLNLYDYGARNYDPAIGRWMNIDGMAEKYLSNSSYHYADNNPVLNYDVDGNYFANSFSQRMASSYQEHSRGRIASNNSSITYMQSLLDEGGHSNDIISVLNDLINVLNNSNSQLQSSIDEVSVLMISNQAYNIIDAGESAMMGITSYDKISRIVNITAPLQNGFGLLGHEIRHAYQFDRGIEGLAYTGARNFKVSDLIGIDLADEWNAYKIQNSLSQAQDIVRIMSF